MCGIAGIALRPGMRVAPATLAALATSLGHRGPDGAGTHVSERAALVHTRLAIIDLETGDQPLFGADAALIANGEIYNDPDLRAGLEEVEFRTHSDCEPPLHLNRADPDIIPHLRGMYAIAIDDDTRRTVSLTRDPFGIKPLYRAATASGTAFASEPQALLDAGPAAREIAPAVLREMLDRQFSAGSATAFTGISRVEPGATLILRDGEIERTLRHSPIEAGKAPRDEEAALADLDRVLTESVDLHRRSDVPYGMFLSGGIDSTAILALMARLGGSPVEAFTAGFDIAGVADERDDAETAAKALGANHHRVEISEAMVWRHLPEIVACMDDPAADPAIIPTWFLGRLAREAVTVVLSGEGGDEIFAGYGRYRAASRPWPFRKRMRRRSAFDGLGLLRDMDEPPTPLPPHDDKAQATRLDAAQREDIAGWLPNDLLLKLDRCLMAHGVEGRTPFLDREVARFAFSLPDALRVRGRFGKIPLRKWLERHCPAARPFARKQGFDVPIGAWIAGQGDRLGDLVAKSPIIEEMARPDAVRSAFRQAGDKRIGPACWRLLFLALWHRRHGLGLAPEGDVFDILSQW